MISAIKTLKPGNAITLKLYECLIYNRIQPIIETFLPNGQTGFRPVRSCHDRSILESSCYTNQVAIHVFDLKTSVVLVDLSAAYDTAWYRGLTLKLLKLFRVDVWFVLSCHWYRKVASMYTSVWRNHVLAPSPTVFRKVPSLLHSFSISTSTICHQPSVRNISMVTILKSSHKKFLDIKRDPSQDVNTLRIFFTN